MAALGESPYFVGIDAGSSSVKVVALHDAGAGFDVAFRACEAHKGSIAACARKLLIAAVSSEELAGGACAGIAATGACAEAIREAAPGVRVLEDVPAMTLGAAVMAPGARSIVQVGRNRTPITHSCWLRLLRETAPPDLLNATSI